LGREEKRGDPRGPFRTRMGPERERGKGKPDLHMFLEKKKNEERKRRKKW